MRSLPFPPSPSLPPSPSRRPSCVCSQQRPLVEERVQGVAGRLAPAQTAVQALEEARHQILISKVLGACLPLLLA